MSLYLYIHKTIKSTVLNFTTVIIQNKKTCSCILGVGKTTLIQKACETLMSSGIAIDGFYTEEVREGGRRIGFDVVTLSGKRGILSRIGNSSGSSAGRREYRVGQFVVDLPAFENLVLPTFRNASKKLCSLQLHLVQGNGRRVFVIDEIGKMELFSHSFIQAVRQTLDSSASPILGTIPIPKGKPLGLVEEVRSRGNVKLFTVSTVNRTQMYHIYMLCAHTTQTISLYICGLPWRYHKLV
ncbi:NTPCR triphosphatase, partial [Amia calva]|nr:NTPCR triphosphatase [Amia calva]